MLSCLRARTIRVCDPQIRRLHKRTCVDGEMRRCEEHVDDVVLGRAGEGRD